MLYWTDIAPLNSELWMKFMVVSNDGRKAYLHLEKLQLANQNSKQNTQPQAPHGKGLLASSFKFKLLKAHYKILWKSH